MRIGVPTNDGVAISEHFGRSAGFLIYEIENGQIMAVETRANAAQHSHPPGTCGHTSAKSGTHSHAGILAALNGCDTVICAGMGARAAEALKCGGVSVIAIAPPRRAEDAVAAYLRGSLETTDGEFCRCQH
jgi:predicted Fe-Mo cluster-binding NifX family protein